MAGDVTDEQLAAWEALAAEATRRSQPWYVDAMIDRPSGKWGPFVRAGDDETDDTFITPAQPGMRREDAAFIAAARDGWPATMRALREARAEAERLRCRECGGSGLVHADTCPGGDCEAGECPVPCGDCALGAAYRDLYERQLEIEQLRGTLEFHQEFWAAREARLRDLAKERGIWDEVAAILANGTADPREPPTYAQMYQVMKHRAEKAEAQVAVMGGEWCARNRAEGRSGCDACAWCCQQAKTESERWRRAYEASVPPETE